MIKEKPMDEYDLLVKKIKDHKLDLVDINNLVDVLIKQKLLR